MTCRSREDRRLAYNQPLHEDSLELLSVQQPDRDLRIDVYVDEVVNHHKVGCKNLTQASAYLKPREVDSIFPPLVARLCGVRDLGAHRRVRGLREKSAVRDAHAVIDML